MYVVGAVKLSALPDKKLDSVLLPEPLGPTIVSLSPGASLILSGQPRAGRLEADYRPTSSIPCKVQARAPLP